MSATWETVVPEAAPRYSTLEPGPIQMWSTPGGVWGGGWLVGRSIGRWGWGCLFREYGEVGGGGWVNRLMMMHVIAHFIHGPVSQSVNSTTSS